MQAHSILISSSLAVSQLFQNFLFACPRAVGEELNVSKHVSLWYRYLQEPAFCSPRRLQIYRCSVMCLQVVSSIQMGSLLVTIVISYNLPV
jgi:hypothetical protein